MRDNGVPIMTTRRSFIKAALAVPAVAVLPKLDVKTLTEAEVATLPHIHRGNPIGTTVNLRNVKLAFPRLFEAGPLNAPFKPRFSASFIVPPDHPDAATLHTAMREVAESRWGEKARYKTSVRDNHVHASSMLHPCVIDRDRTALTALDGAGDKLRPGCHVNAIVAVYAAELGPHKRVAVQLRGVQYVGDA